jgi:hypothetical protein
MLLLIGNTAGGKDLTSNMKASASAGRCSGWLLSLAMALSKVAVSGPCGVMHTCRLAPAQSIHVASILVEMGHLTPKAAAPARWPLTTTVQEVHHPGSCLPLLQSEHSGCKVRACTSRNKASLLGLVGTIDEAHELRHHIAVVVWRPEGVVRNCPAWREHHEVCCGCACGQSTRSSPIPVQAEHELAS